MFLALAVLGALAYGFWPAPVLVDVGRVSRGAMRVTVDEDGRTRIRERYLVAAPLAGRVSRITLKPGDPVEAGKTVLARIDPSDPALLDPRARAEAQAKVSAAEAALEQAGAAVQRTSAALEQAQTETLRLRQLQGKATGQEHELEIAITTEAIRAAEAKAGVFARDIARFELEQARAALVRTHPVAEGQADDWRFDIAAPISGRVLRVLHESAGVVTPGTPLIEVGDPQDLELEIDVLSSDGVAVRPGAPVSIEHWGGPAPLRGVVRLVEPAAFLKVSALGVEEQRVNVIIDLVDPPEARTGLGDAFRVEARIVTWESSDVLRVPASALFRTAQSWAVYAVVNGRAQRRAVELGRRNSNDAEVVSGLAEGEEVILYPGDRVREGARVEPRAP